MQPASNDADQAPDGPRAGVKTAARRSRNGCIPCRNRHVRCNEAKPTCSSCERLMLKCFGHGAKKRKGPPPPAAGSEASRRVLAPRPVQLSSEVLDLLCGVRPTVCPLSGLDVVYFDVFRREVVHDVAGIGYQEFWTRTVMRESLLDESVRHGVLAIGGLSLAQPHFLPLRDPSAMLGEHHRAALNHHGQALEKFNQRLARGPVEPRSVLIATALFMTFELFLGSTSAAGKLLERGYRLLEGSPSAALPKNPSREKSEPSPELDSLDDIKHMLLRLSGVNSVFPFLSLATRLDMAHSTVSASSLSTTSEGDEISLRDLERLWREMSLRFMRTRAQLQQARQDHDAERLAQLEDDVIRLVGENRSWGEILKARLEQENDRDALRNLRLMRLQQAAFDLFASDPEEQQSQNGVFRDLVHRCENILNDSLLSPLRTRLTTDSGALPVLLCVISLCKDPEIRRYAFETARKYCRGQGQERRQQWIQGALAQGSLQVIPTLLGDKVHPPRVINDYLLMRSSAQFSVWLSRKQSSLVKS